MGRRRVHAWDPSSPAAPLSSSGCCARHSPRTCRLFQDIPHEVPAAGNHEQRNDPRQPGHAARILPGTTLETIVGKDEIQVNSTHHQAVKDPGRAKISALAPDQIVEAIELAGRFAIGVQWHPELLDGAEHLALYRALVDRAGK
jgi:putative glutamine amidotransferase